MTKRNFVSLALKIPVVAWLLQKAPGFLSASPRESGPNQQTEHFDVVVIGSGFGGTLNALTLARHFKARNKGERVLILERGAWWSTPVETIQDKPINTPGFLSKTHGQPVRFWPSADHLRGLVDVLVRCFKRPGQEDGLYDVTHFKGKGGTSDDGLFVAHANGVGGGSLIYANMTIEPPDSVFRNWPISWDNPDLGADKTQPKDRRTWFEIARHAIGYGVLSAWDYWESGNIPYAGPDLPKKALNTGLSNVATRSARLDPQFKILPDPQNPQRTIKQIDPTHYTHTPDSTNDIWIDRARVFQTTAGQVLDDLKLPPNFGTADSSINDLTPEGNPFGGPANYPPGNKQPKNYCERQGRCVLGCLPGARQTLNKQLMIAMWGTPPDDFPKVDPQIGEQFLQVRALAQVASISPIKVDGADGYEVTYSQRANGNPSNINGTITVKADRVILAAGCIGTNELLLKCKQSLKTLPRLSGKLGYGFSTNGDYLAFIEGTKDTVNLTRGPVQTSFAHFFGDDASRFHTIEDLGIPRVFSVLFGKGFLRKFAETGMTQSLLFSITVGQLRQLLQQVIRVVTSLASPVPPEEFQSEDIPGRNIMGVAGMGREAAVGQFRLGGPGETALRVSRTDHKAFDEDPIYAEIKNTIARFTSKLTGNPGQKVTSPLTLTSAAARKGSSRTPTTIVGVAHPLGGCRIARNADEGVVDEFGRVFGYKNLYVADASIIPTSLGVNPSLTISALALRVAHRIAQEYKT